MTMAPASNHLRQLFMRIRNPHAEGVDDGWIHDTNTTPPVISAANDVGIFNLQVRATIFHAANVQSQRICLMREFDNSGAWIIAKPTASLLRIVDSDFLVNGADCTETAKLGGANAWRSGARGQVETPSLATFATSWGEGPEETDVEFSVYFKIFKSLFDGATFRLRCYKFNSSSNQVAFTDGYEDDSVLTVTIRRYTDVRGKSFFGPWVGGKPHLGKYVDGRSYAGARIGGTSAAGTYVDGKGFAGPRIDGVPAFAVKET